jgi:hypothetical protein
MALTEQKILKQVTILSGGTVNVQWSNQILRDGEVISETYERCAYGVDQKDQFLAEIPGAANYIAALGW